MDNAINKENLERLFFEKIIQMEGLIVAKTKVYSRLLTDAALAKQMEQIALRREKSKSAWLEILTGQPQKSSMNTQEEQEEQ